ncbi:MAG: hypothetical protein NUV65_06370 [Candidatus Roizmanbacteria bacterium]|nr:hypothetical protein [Candidatus Roizmanbacteria bacterium]
MKKPMSMETRNAIPLLIQSGDKDKVIKYIENTFKEARVVETNTEGDLTIEKLRTIMRLSSIQQTQSIVCVVWGFDTATIQTQNAFLKTLEEQPPYLLYCLICTNEQQIVQTILSRCQSIHLTRVISEEILDDIPLVVRTWTREKAKRTREDGLAFIDTLLLKSTNTMYKNPASARHCKNLLTARQSIDAYNIDPITALECTLLLEK